MKSGMEKIKQVYSIWHMDLEELILKELDIEIDIQNREHNNESYIEIDVTDDLSWCKDPDESIREIRNGIKDPEVGWDLEFCMNYLALKDIIERGAYIITIWW